MADRPEDLNGESIQKVGLWNDERYLSEGCCSVRFRPSLSGKDLRYHKLASVLADVSTERSLPKGVKKLQFLERIC